MFKDKILLITGGTGSFGNAVLKRFLDTDIEAASVRASHSSDRLHCRAFQVRCLCLKI